jgi:heme-degrading monooxygenase HmoA
MYTRTTTTTAEQSSLDAGINHVREVVMPALEEFDGFVGLSMLVDRSTGRCIVTSAWESEEAMRASTDGVQELRDRAVEILGGLRPDLDHWEIAVLHREHETAEGACARVTWVRVDPAQVDAALEMFKTSTLPALEEMDGMCSVSVMVDRRSGRGVSCVVYDSAEAIERNREQIDRIRAKATGESGADITDEHDFDVAIAHLRVPELV